MFGSYAAQEQVRKISADLSFRSLRQKNDTNKKQNPTKTKHSFFSLHFFPCSQKTKRHYGTLVKDLSLPRLLLSLSLTVSAFWPVHRTLSRSDFRCPPQRCLPAQTDGVAGCRLNRAGTRRPPRGPELCSSLSSNSLMFTAIVPQRGARLALWEMLILPSPSKRAALDFHKLSIFLLCLHRLQQKAAIRKEASLTRRLWDVSLSENSNLALQTCCTRHLTSLNTIPSVSACRAVCTLCCCTLAYAVCKPASIGWVWIISGRKDVGGDAGWRCMNWRG